MSIIEVQWEMRYILVGTHLFILDEWEMRNIAVLTCGRGNNDKIMIR
jgi:hypothetical protein